MDRIPGQTRRSIRGHSTFVPDPLPPPLDLDAALVNGLEETTHLLGQVDMCRVLLPNANLLIYGSLRREAIASSTIEGTIASPEELVRFEAIQETDRQDVREVANYLEAINWGVKQLPSMPIAARLILGLQERVLAGVRGASASGRYKERQNWIGASRDTPIEEADFVPPSPEDTPQLMADLERYFNLQNQQPRLVQCALAHYQFETIHPFHDGNGRVGRLLIIMQLIQLGLLSAPLIYPSVYFERRRSEYVARLQAVRQHGDWSGWIAFFVDGVAQQCRETIALTQTLISLQHHLEDEIPSVRRRSTTLAVIKVFFDIPVLPVRDIAQRARISINSAQTVLDELQEQQIVHEITGKQRGRVYACRPILDVIFGVRRPTGSEEATENQGEEA
jgi:Fic family protein